MYRLLTIKIFQIIFIIIMSFNSLYASFPADFENSRNHHELIVGFNDVRSKFSQKPVLIKTFRDAMVKSVSMMKILGHMSREYLFVVSRNYTLIQIDLNSLDVIKTFIMDYCKASPSICQKEIHITHLSSTEISGIKLIYFCFYQEFPPGYATNPYSTSMCRVPKNKITSQIQWVKKGFSSNKLNYGTYAVKYGDYIFTGAYTDHSLSVIRTTEPNIYGKMDRFKQLVTPRAPFYFEANSQFLTGFQYESSVYFVISESIEVASKACYKDKKNAKKRIRVTRLLRICSNDPGGPVDSSKHNFGTSAKADLICPSLSSSNGEYESNNVFTRAVDAYWSDNLLFVLFTSQNDLSKDSVICTYKPSTFDKVFDGPMKYTEIHGDQHNSCTYDNNRDIIPNTLQSLCKRLASKELNSEQLKKASNMASIGLYRLNSIEPVNNKALLHLGHINSFDKLKVIKLPDDTRIMITYSSKSNMVWFYNYRERSESGMSILCYQEFYKAQNHIKDIIYRISGREVLLYILTKDSVIEKLDLTKRVCENFSRSKRACLEQSPLFCGWSLKHNNCSVKWNDHTSSNRFSSDISLWTRSQKCLKQSSSADLIPPEICHINQTGLQLSCQCKHTCLNSRCKMTINNCRGKVRTNKWSSWSAWSSCKYEVVKRRSRESKQIQDPILKEMINEVEKCNSQNRVAKSEWTLWLRQISTMSRYQAHCMFDASNGTIKPVIAKQERNCRNRKCFNLPDYTANSNHHWSSWSKCIETNFQYRLKNCTKLTECLTKDIQVNMCATDNNSKNFKPLEDQEAAKKYTMIHLLFAIMATSVVWLLIAVIVFMILCCQQTNHSRNHRSRSKWSSWLSFRSERRNPRTTSASVNNIIYYNGQNQPSSSTHHYPETNLHQSKHPFVFRPIAAATSNDYATQPITSSMINTTSSSPSRTDSFSTSSIN